ncbi:MAG: YkgJ family cysteine cluster protein, partial [Armatimonadota bacterium]|nr:YkgJ family cysteine cluster protein [Armatimonadota bacterium]
MREAILLALARLDAERPAEEEAAYTELEAQASPPALALCDGCTRCAFRCVDHIEMSYPEFSRLLRALAALPEARLRALLAQEKRILWAELATVEMCPFLDMESRYCALYPARPLVCRIFGLVPWFPCPEGRVEEPI